MQTKVLFNIDKKLKGAAMKKARRDGLTFSSVLNIATRAYVADRIVIDAFERDLESAREDVRRGRVASHEDLLKKYHL